MSGRQQKRLRKNINKNAILDERAQMRKLNLLPVIPAQAVIPYLMGMFKGKSGYKYISIAKHGSLFIHDNYKNLVPIILHQSFPETSTMGRFHDPNQKDLAVGLVRVAPIFKGFVLSKTGTLYPEGKESEGITNHFDPYIVSLGRISAQEYNAAVRSQEEAYMERMKSVNERINERLKHIAEASDPYGNPYGDDIIDVTPYMEETEEPI